MPAKRYLSHGAILLLLAIGLTLLPPTTIRAQDAVVRPHPDGSRFMTPDGRPFFVLGYNYEGPYDRAWRMWQEFDAALIEADIARARGGGANTLRLFIQEPLPDEILANDFSKLDTVIDIVARHDMFVLLTLYDYSERDLTAVAEVNRRIAEHYRGNPTILAYDLRNEPQFLTLASATYPSDVSVPLQQPDLVAVYGERVAREDMAEWRASGDGRVLPASWSDDQAYAYANNLAYYRELIADAEQWVLAEPGRNILAALTAPELQQWLPLWNALNETLAAWIEVQRQAIRAVDADHMITIGWNNPLLALLPANGDLLDFMSFHRFPRSPTAASVDQTMALGAGLRSAFPNLPLLFEELGYSTHDINAEGAAALEMATALRAYSEGYAGFLKWMLTDLPPVGNPREDNFGAIRTDGSPKPIYHALGALGTYIDNSAAAPHGDLNAWDREDGPSYSFLARDAHYIAGPEASGTDMRFRFTAPGQFLLRKRGAIYLLTTQPGEVTLNLPELMPVWTGAGFTVEQRVGEDWTPIDVGGTGDALSFAVQPATPYRVTLPRHTDAVEPKPDCRFFAETGHNLCSGFLRYWEENGGLDRFGYPITEEFLELNRQDGNTYTVQYFERNRFEYHPELAGTPNAILLGLLGSDLTANRQDELPFQPVAAAEPGRDFFPETGHTLGGVFRDYWQANGGLAVFGYPISEEFQEYNPADGQVYTVQYFERNRFEYHPELAGTPYVVLLGLLGNQTVDGNGWR